MRAIPWLFLAACVVIVTTVAYDAGRDSKAKPSLLCDGPVAELVVVSHNNSKGRMTTHSLTVGECTGLRESTLIAVLDTLEQSFDTDTAIKEP